MIRTHVHPARTAAAACISTLMLGLTGCSMHGPTAENPVGDGAYTAQPRQTGIPGIATDRELRMPPVELLSAQRQAYSITSLSAESWRITLNLDDPTEAKIDAIDAAGVRVKVSLRNLTTGALTVKEGRLLGDWSQTIESQAGSPTAYEVMWFRAQRRDAYELAIEVTPAQPAADTSVTASLLLTNDPR